MTLPGRLSGLLPAAALALLALLLALFAGAGQAQQEVQPVPALAGRVIDATGTLTPEQVRALDERLAAIELQRGSQVVVLIVASTQPEDIAAYAQRVADRWKIGRREVGDGVLVVVAKDDRKVRIEVAKALEGAIPDLAANRIIEQTIVPAFRAGDFPGGLNAAVGRIAERIGSEAANEGLPAPAPRRQGGGSKQAAGGFDLQDLAIFLFVGVPVVGAMLTGIFGRKLGALATGGVVGGLGWWLTASLLAAAGAGLLSLLLVGVLGVGSGRRGRGGFLPGVVLGGLGGRGGFGGGGDGGGGGGFSSGGGGNFGGGGASGGW